MVLLPPVKMLVLEQSKSLDQWNGRLSLLVPSTVCAEKAGLEGASRLSEDGLRQPQTFCAEKRIGHMFRNDTGNEAAKNM